MASTTDIKKGVCMKYNNDIFSIVDFQHVKPGKGGAFVRAKMKSLTNGKVIENTWNSGAAIDLVRVERRKFQYLYKDDTGFNFMDQNTFEQITLQDTMIENGDLYKEGQEVEIIFDAENERPLSCELPLSINLRITESEQGVKGNTANNPMKNAKLETGASILIPMFVNEGDLVRINTEERAYVERVKE